jgi:hypothetical protein
VVQTPHLSYSVGFFNEFYTHQVLAPELELDARANDFQNQKYRLGANYARKRFSASGLVDYGPTEYKVTGILQSNYVSLDTSVTLLYNLSDDARATISYARFEQEFETTPINDSVSESLLIEVLHRF